MRPENDLSLISVVDDNDDPIAAIPRREVIEKGLNHRVSHVISTFEGALVLQRLSLHHTRSPGLIGSSAAGFVRPGESYRRAALRLMKTELGVAAEKLDFLARIDMKVGAARKFIGVFSAEIDMLPAANSDQYSELLCVEIEGVKSMLINEPEVFAKTFLPVFKAWEEKIFYGQGKA